MRYGWKCKACGARWDSPSREFSNCVNCLTPGKRDYSTVQLTVSAFKPHFNHAVGAYVSSSRHFDDVLKVRAEAAGSEFTRIDPGEAPTPSTDTQIFETQAKTIRDRGIDPRTLVE